MNRTVKPFSSGYFLVGGDVLAHSGDHAIVPMDYYDELTNFVTRPLLKSRDDHFWAYPEHGVPADTVALPAEETERDRDDPVLLAKDDTARRLITAGEKQKPQ